MLGDLIAATHGQEAAEVYGRFVPSASDREAVGQVGIEVLSAFPSMPGACVMMSALLVAMLDGRTQSPAYVVAGRLSVRQTLIFGEKEPIDGRARFSASNPSWDGHAWVVLGSYIVDVSIFRTAYSAQSNNVLSDFIRAEFGVGKGLMLIRDSDAAQSGLLYVPQYVLSADQLPGLVAGAMSLIPQ